MKSTSHYQTLLQIDHHRLVDVFTDFMWDRSSLSDTPLEDLGASQKRLILKER